MTSLESEQSHRGYKSDNIGAEKISAVKFMSSFWPGSRRQTAWTLHQYAQANVPGRGVHFPVQLPQVSHFPHDYIRSWKSTTYWDEYRFRLLQFSKSWATEPFFKPLILLQKRLLDFRLHHKLGSVGAPSSGRCQHIVAGGAAYPHGFLPSVCPERARQGFGKQRPTRGLHPDARKDAEK